MLTTQTCHESAELPDPWGVLHVKDPDKESDFYFFLILKQSDCVVKQKGVAKWGMFIQLFIPNLSDGEGCCDYIIKWATLQHFVQEHMYALKY